MRKSKEWKKGTWLKWNQSGRLQERVTQGGSTTHQLTALEAVQKQTRSCGGTRSHRLLDLCRYGYWIVGHCRNGSISANICAFGVSQVLRQPILIFVIQMDFWLSWAASLPDIAQYDIVIVLIRQLMLSLFLLKKLLLICPLLCLNTSNSNFPWIQVSQSSGLNNMTPLRWFISNCRKRLFNVAQPIGFLYSPTSLIRQWNLKWELAVYKLLYISSHYDFQG